MSLSRSLKANNQRKRTTDGYNRQKTHPKTESNNRPGHDGLQKTPRANGWRY